MKIAVFSDTHGSPQNMLAAIREYRPDQVIHLGDGMDDAALIEREFPMLPVCTVPGNCDHREDLPEYKVIRLGSLTAFITHGHRYGVRYGKLDTLLYAAECCGAQIAMFGHTHRAVFDQAEGVFYLNPGTAGRFAGSSWAKLELGGEGEISCEIVRTND